MVKLLFFPLTWRCFSDILIEIGLVPKFVGGDILAYMLVCLFCPYSYMIEMQSCPPAIKSMIFHYCDEKFGETRTYTIIRAVNRV